jgi:acetoin utilization deacetylase AcuC-like enzyme
MTLLYYDPVFLKHETGSHPECPQRLVHIEKQLEQRGLLQKTTRPDWGPVDLSLLTAVHDNLYVDQARRFAANGGGHIESDTVVSPASFDVATLAAGAACDATRRVLLGEDRDALCLVRPPGHHALSTTAMGFCLFNNVAIAANMAIGQHDLDRVLVIDWDVHHGNGTQDAFWESDQVGFFSIHRWPFYPGSGDENETGHSKGLGATVNIPVEFGVSRQDYLSCFARELDDFANRIRPQVILLSAGFDTHVLDPVGSLGLETEDFITLTEMVAAVADQHADGRLISVLEGGYNTAILPDCIAAHLKTLLKRQDPRVAETSP